MPTRWLRHANLRFRPSLSWLGSLLASIGLVLSTLPAMPALAEPLSVHDLWRQGQGAPFDGWVLDGTLLSVDRLTLQGQNGLTGSAVGPIVPRSPSFREAIVSWNAATPPGTWIETRLRARVNQRWTDWYTMGVWSSDSTGHRHSVRGQTDSDGRVQTDTLELTWDADAFQVRVDLIASSADTSPTVSLITVATSAPGTALTASSVPRAGARGTTLPVPERSQMIYPNGGEVWCSPTSTSMVMAYWAAARGAPELDISVPEVAAGTYDPVYRGNGNWPFNTAFAARSGLIAYVHRMQSVTEVESWIAAGIPVIASLGWEPGELPEAPIASTNGHLLVIVGFTPTGDVVVNDPAGDPRRNQQVRRVYARERFESLWRTHSNGTVYLIYPGDMQPPV